MDHRDKPGGDEAGATHQNGVWGFSPYPPNPRIGQLLPQAICNCHNIFGDLILSMSKGEVGNAVAATSWFDKLTMRSGRGQWVTTGQS
jgi:hypothetical protein